MDLNDIRRKYFSERKGSITAETCGINHYNDGYVDWLEQTLVKNLTIPVVSNNEVAVCQHKEYRWHKELDDNTEECVNCGHLKQTDC